MVEYQVGDTIFELLNNSSEKFSRAQAWILPTDTVIQSTRLSVKSSELSPLTRIGMLLPPFGSKGETHSRVYMYLTIVQKKTVLLLLLKHQANTYFACERADFSQFF
jgi:hypothetical protein